MNYKAHRLKIYFCLSVPLESFVVHDDDYDYDDYQCLAVSHWSVKTKLHWLWSGQVSVSAWNLQHYETLQWNCGPAPEQVRWAPRVSFFNLHNNDAMPTQHRCCVKIFYDKSSWRIFGMKYDLMDDDLFFIPPLIVFVDHDPDILVLNNCRMEVLNTSRCRVKLISWLLLVNLGWGRADRQLPLSPPHWW